MDRARSRAGVRAALVAAAVLVLVAGAEGHPPHRADAAPEATAGVSGGVLTFTDEPQHSASVFMTLTGGNYEFSTNGPILAQPGCSQTTMNSVSCAAAPVTSVSILLGGGMSLDGSDTLTIAAAADPTSVTTGVGSDNVTLGSGDLSSVAGAVTVDAEGGMNDHLGLSDGLLATPAVYNVGSTISRTGFPGVSYSNVETIFLNGGDGSDTFNIGVSPISAEFSMVAGPGDDTVNIGFGNLDPIQAPMTISGETGIDSVHIDDSASPYASGYSVTSVFFSRGSFGVNYDSIESLEIDAAAGNNLISVPSTHASTPLSLNGGEGDDTINVGSGNLTSLGSLVTVEGGAGTGDSVRFFDNSSPGGFYTLERSRLRLAGFPGADYAGFESVLLSVGVGSSNIDLISTANGATTIVNGNGGDDVFRVSAPGLGTSGEVQLSGKTHGSQDTLQFFTGGLGSIAGTGLIATPGRQTVFYDTIELVPPFNTSVDSDTDGCTDVKESGLDPTLGGDRNPLRGDDFFDVNANLTITLDDTLAILGAFGLGPGDPGYDTKYERYTPDTSIPWRSAFPGGGPNMGITLQDALTNLLSFGHDCT